MKTKEQRQKIREANVKKYGMLKLTMELEGDGYFFYGHGLDDRYCDDPVLVELFNDADKSINKFNEHIEKKIRRNGGVIEEWSLT